MVWGPGPNVFYSDQRVALRRAVADFARNQVKHEYGMETGIPTEFAVTPPSYPPFTSHYDRKRARQQARRPPPKKKPPHKPSPHRAHSSSAPSGKRLLGNIEHHALPGDVSQVRTLSPTHSNTVWGSSITQLPPGKTSAGVTPLRVVLYSRGNEGTRSLKLESDLMIAIAHKFEAYTAICCDFSKATMQQQISYAYHADIVSVAGLCTRKLTDCDLLCVCVCVVCTDNRSAWSGSGQRNLRPKRTCDD